LGEISSLLVDEPMFVHRQHTRKLRVLNVLKKLAGLEFPGVASEAIFR